VEEIETAGAETNANVYPNPVMDEFSVAFNLETRSHITIQLFDMQGRKIETFFSGTERPGQKSFSFNSAALPAGIYTLYIRSAENTLAVKKIVVK
ncbi:MAG: T9SS type A sorting domain-containing protein, partial [Bacteroidia bacterium]